MHYLDYNAAAPVYDEVLASYQKSCKIFWANQNSQHKLGRDALSHYNQLKIKMLEIFGLYPSTNQSNNHHLLCYESATEAIQKSIHNEIEIGKSICITSKMEHPYILQLLQSMEASHMLQLIYLPISDSGQINQDSILYEIQKNIDKKIILCLQMANSEIGAIQNFALISKIKSQYNNIKWVCDAVAIVGKVQIDLQNLNPDYFIFNAYKIGGLVGQAYCIQKNDTNSKLSYCNIAMLESNILAINMSLSNEKCWNNIIRWNEKIKDVITECGGKIITSHHSILNTIAITMPNISNMIQLMHFDRHNIAVSIGTACTSKSNRPSIALDAIGINNEDNLSTIRISMGHRNNDQDINAFISTWKKLYYA